jgi:hypothetical protein
MSLYLQTSVMTALRFGRLGCAFFTSTIAVFLLMSCSEEPRAIPPAAGPTAFSPEQFSDIPLPRGYAFSPGEDQLTVTLAGGTVRRFEVVMEQRESAKQQSAVELLDEMERDLTSRGWITAPNHSDKLQWHKGQERLVLETGRTNGRTTIRLRLRSAILTGP